MDADFRELLEELAADVRVLEAGEFVLLQVAVGRDLDPYAQVAREPDGSWYCEIVSARYLPPSSWPLDEFVLVADGWAPPDHARANWSRAAATGEQAAEAVITALRHGRACPDPYAYSWAPGRLPRRADRVGHGNDDRVGRGDPRSACRYRVRAQE
jgi:hypothetical protein